MKRTMFKEYFTVTEDHLKLLRKANVTWYSCEFGAPGIDCKRPYGNSDVYEDMVEILGLDMECDTLSDEQINKLNSLQSELVKALQIILNVGKFETGEYVSELYGDWVKV